MIAASVEDYRRQAGRRLPNYLFQYVEGGSLAEQTLHANIADMLKIRIRQRVMRDVATLSTAVELFGQDLAIPLVLSPVGLAGMYARRGEAQAARAAATAGVPMALSSVSICATEEVAQAAGRAPWFQLYMIRDKGYMTELLQRTSALGCPVLVFTVDLPLPGPRYRDVRSGFTKKPSLRRTVQLAADTVLHPRWMIDVLLRGRPHCFGNFAPGIPEARTLRDFGGWVVKNYDQKLAWADLAWLRANWSGPIVVKGILDPDDAEAALFAGADGIVVSNHGGRQLDGAQSTISALPGIAKRINKRIPVLFDGGIRTGADMFKAMALGADGCMIGRAWAYGLAARGEAGVAHVLAILAQELRVTMTLAGCADIKVADPSMIV